MACTAEMLSLEMGKAENYFLFQQEVESARMLKIRQIPFAQQWQNGQAVSIVVYVPDQVSQEVHESLLKEPTIMEILNLIKSANIVIHGIGDAITMAERRKTEEAAMKKIIEKKAVGEAFGYYFNEDGEIVHKVPTIGLQHV